MKRKLAAALVVLLSGLVFVAVGVLTAADVADEFKIYTSGYPEKKRGAVAFTHAKHVKDHAVACDECHHDYKDGKNLWKEGDPVQKCCACHDPGADKEATPRNLERAYHNNCRDCHRAFLKENPDSKVPAKCTECHERKS